MRRPPAPRRRRGPRLAVFSAAAATAVVVAAAVAGATFASPGSQVSGEVWAPTPSRRVLLQFAASGLAASGAGLAGAAAIPAKYFGGNITDFTGTPSGLLLLDLASGSGETCCAAGARATVEWRIRRLNGQLVDASGGLRKSSADTQAPAPLQFVPQRLVEGISGVGMRDDVVEGIREAVLGMQVGGLRRAVIPKELGWRTPEQLPLPVDARRLARLISARLEPLAVDLKLLALTLA